jgi:hypothetical protein
LGPSERANLNQYRTSFRNDAFSIIYNSVDGRSPEVQKPSNCEQATYLSVVQSVSQSPDHPTQFDIFTCKLSDRRHQYDSLQTPEVRTATHIYLSHFKRCPSVLSPYKTCDRSTHSRQPMACRIRETRQRRLLGSYARFEVFTAVTMMNGVFWDVTPCGSCKNRRFGGTYRLHQGDKIR